MYTFVQCRHTQVSERKIWEAGSQFKKWNLSEQASNFCDTNFAKIESHSPTCLNEFHRLSCLNVIWYRPLPLCYTFVFVGFYGSNIIRISSLRTTFSKTKHTYTREKTEKKEPPRQSSVRRAAHAKFFLVVSKRRIEEAFLRWNENMQQCFQSAVPFVFFFSRLIMCVSYFHWGCTGFALCLSLLSLPMPRFMLRFDFWKPHLDNGEHRLHLLNTHHSLPTLFI